TRYKIRKPATYYVELNVLDLIHKANFSGKDLSLKTTETGISYKSLSKFPSVSRDLAFLIDRNIKSASIIQAMKHTSDNIILVEQFDEFESDKLGKDKKSVAYHLYLQDLNKTLTDADAETIIANIVNTIKMKFDAQLRA
ncbi:MAG TPA: hypothetical protein PK263_04905, partial [bacterium]|nr:hypothetical protein [bacterium]